MWPRPGVLVSIHTTTRRKTCSSVRRVPNLTLMTITMILCIVTIAVRFWLSVKRLEEKLYKAPPPYLSLLPSPHTHTLLRRDQSKKLRYESACGCVLASAANINNKVDTVDWNMKIDYFNDDDDGDDNADNRCSNSTYHSVQLMGR